MGVTVTLPTFTMWSEAAVLSELVLLGDVVVLDEIGASPRNVTADLRKVVVEAGVQDVDLVGLVEVIGCDFKISLREAGIVEREEVGGWVDLVDGGRV